MEFFLAVAPPVLLVVAVACLVVYVSNSIAIMFIGWSKTKGGETINSINLPGGWIVYAVIALALRVVILALA